MLIQEPYMTPFNGIRTPTNFRPVYPINRFQDDAPISSVRRFGPVRSFDP